MTISPSQPMASRCRLSAARISSEPGTLQRCELQTHHHGQFRKISFGSPGRDHPIDCLLRVRATLSLDQERCKGFCRLGCGKADRTRCRTDFRGGEKRNYASWPSKSRPEHCPGGVEDWRVYFPFAILRIRLTASANRFQPAVCACTCTRH